MTVFLSFVPLDDKLEKDRTMTEAEIKEQEAKDAAEKEAAEKKESAGSSAETIKAEKPEDLIQRRRYDEKNEETKVLQARVDQLETDKAEATERQLAEQGKWKEVAKERGTKLEKAEAKAAQVDSYEGTLKELLEAEIEKIPEDLRGLIPKHATTQQKLEWIAKNGGLLAKPKAFSLGAGKRGSSDGSKSVVLSAEQKEMAKNMGVDEEEYAKHI